MTTLTVEAPSWIKEEEAREEFLRNLRGKALLKMEFYRSKATPFERKYGLSFSEFQKKVHAASEESFEEWDDLMEWEAYYTASIEWEGRYQELVHVSTTH